MKDISKSRKTCVVVLAAAGLAFGSLAYAESGSGKNEGKRTLSPESTHGTEKSWVPARVALRERELSSPASPKAAR